MLTVQLEYIFLILDFTHRDTRDRELVCVENAALSVRFSGTADSQ